MTKILIVSDNHSDETVLVNILAAFQSEVDVCVHCGDSEFSSSSTVMKQFVGVRGNCDWDANYPTETVIDARGTNIFATHGHLYGIKQNLDKIRLRAEELGVDIACFGHSHLMGIEVIDGVLFINPGSVSLPRGRKESSFAILEVKEENYEIIFYDAVTFKELKAYSV
ncbi:MAG: metallophosphoesterase [Bacilli bacterium]